MSGTSQPLPDAESVCVEYPAFVRNVGRAMDTLGGPDAISKAENGKDTFLSLFWRPDDALSHPIYGDRNSKSGLLLRISRKKGECGDNPEGEEGDSEVKAEIVSVMRVSYKFSGMSDFTFAEMGGNSEEKETVPGSVELGKGSEPLLTVPPLFSKVDYPLDYAFKDLGTRYHKHRQQRVKLHYSRGVRNCRISFYAIGDIPKQRELAENADVETKKRWNYLCDLFDERPIWSDAMLMHKIGDKHDRKVIFPLLTGLCYRFRNGPWQSLWVVRGYDPRTDEDARRYQTILYKIPKNWYYKAKRLGIHEYLKEAKPNIEELNRFQEIPVVFQNVLQVCDLRDDTIQWVVEDESHIAANCVDPSGWFLPEAWTKIQDKVKTRFKELFENHEKKARSSKKGGGKKDKDDETDEMVSTNMLASFLAEMDVEDDSGNGNGDVDEEFENCDDLNDIEDDILELGNLEIGDDDMDAFDDGDPF